MMQASDKVRSSKVLSSKLLSNKACSSKVRFLDKRVQPRTIAVTMGLLLGAFYLLTYLVR